MTQHTVVRAIQQACEGAGLPKDGWLDFDGHVAHWDARSDSYIMQYAEYHNMTVTVPGQALKAIHEGHGLTFKAVLTTSLQRYAEALEAQAAKIRAFLKEPQ